MRIESVMNLKLECSTSPAADSSNILLYVISCISRISVFRNFCPQPYPPPPPNKPIYEAFQSFCNICTLIRALLSSFNINMYICIYVRWYFLTRLLFYILWGVRTKWLTYLASEVGDTVAAFFVFFTRKTNGSNKIGDIICYPQNCANIRAVSFINARLRLPWAYANAEIGTQLIRRFGTSFSRFSTENLLNKFWSDGGK